MGIKEKKFHGVKAAPKDDKEGDSDEKRMLWASLL
jgi:hypothetical protein